MNNKTIIRYGAVWVLLIGVSELVSAGGSFGLLPDSLSGIWIYLIVMIIGIGILLYFLYSKRGDKSPGSRVDEVKKFHENFRTIPQNERDDKLINLINDDIFAVKGHALSVIDKYFDEIPKEVREYGLKTFADDEHYLTRHHAASILSERFKDVDKHLREYMLEKFADDPDKDTRSYMADVVRWNVCELPEKLQNLLLKFADDDEAEVRLSVAGAVHTNFNSLPENLREKLIKKLSGDKNPGVKKEITRAVKKHRNKLPEKLVNGILENCDIEILE